MQNIKILEAHPHLESRMAIIQDIKKYPFHTMNFKSRRRQALPDQILHNEETKHEWFMMRYTEYF